MKSAEATMRVGQKITLGYLLRQLRGSGSASSVWEAENDGGDVVALKVLKCSDALNAARKIRALQAVRQLRHPNLLRVDQIWCHTGNVIIGMELAEGSLLDLLEVHQSEYGSPIPAEEICSYLSQAARALDYLNCRQHDMDGRRVGFQHCGVQPSNLLLVGDGVKLGDLDQAVPTVSTLAAHTSTGALEYAAPEVFQDRLSDWSDQYSLAVTYCQLRTGVMPFPSLPNPCPRFYNRPAADLSPFPESERAILERALANVPQQRWPSCVEMMAQLNRAVAPPRRTGRSWSEATAVASAR